MSTLPTLSDRHDDPHSYPPGVAFMDGQYLPVQQARISVLDYGFLHSDATYDVVHVWQGAFFRLDAHIDRFFAGMKRLHMQIPFGREQVTEILHNCVALSGLRSAYVEMICTRGTSPTFSRDPREAINRFIAFAIPFGSVASPEQLRTGLHVAVSEVVRIPPASLDPTIKNYHWLDFITALYEAYDRGADTAMLKDDKGNLAEGPGFNLFVAKDGALATPDRGVLMGITRQTVFDICARLDIPCTARPVSQADLETADEVFVTSTAGGVMPVTTVNARRVSTGTVGQLTQRIVDTYWQLHDRDDHRMPITYLSEPDTDA